MERENCDKELSDLYRGDILDSGGHWRALAGAGKSTESRANGVDGGTGEERQESWELEGGWRKGQLAGVKQSASCMALYGRGSAG